MEKWKKRHRKGEKKDKEKKVLVSCLSSILVH